jgi:uncharacterized spore protein YtfJ
MSDTAISDALGRLDAVKDIMSVRRVFGDPYVVDGANVIPVVAIRGGGGGGGGTGGAEGQAQGTGTGLGFGVNARPVGVFVVKDGNVQWMPAVDVVRIVLGGQLVALAAIVLLRGVLMRRARRH